MKLIEKHALNLAQIALSAASVILFACGTQPNHVASRDNMGRGSWGPVIELPTHPEQMVVLPSGKVLMWPWAPDRYYPPHGPLALWDHADGSSIKFPESGIESASGLAFQPNGTLLSAGGDMPGGGVDGNRRSFTFDYRTETLSEVAPMEGRRVAPGATTLGTGEILVTGGWYEQGHVNATPEVWDGLSWTALPDAANEESGLWTFQFLAPDGRLFRAGPERLSDWLEISTGKWADMKPEHRNQVHYHGTAVMYEQGKILLAGGCPIGPEEGWFEQCRDTVLASVEVIDLLDPDPAWRPVTPMTFPRHSHHATLLPDGTVLVTGGSDQPGLWNDESTGVLEAELWNPETETFKVVTAMDKPHHFQSAAVLLPDARVFVAGGVFGSSPEAGRFSWTGQIYSPPYLERGPRPDLAPGPANVKYGAEFTIDTTEPDTIANVVLMGLSASRNGWNATQRLVDLDFETRPGGLRVSAPRDPNQVPPGYYWLFIINEHGVPSHGSALAICREPCTDV